MKVQLEEKLAGRLNEKMAADVPLACRLLGEETPRLCDVPIVNSGRIVFALFENTDELRRSTFDELCNYLDSKEPWEDYDILVFDESFDWFVGFTHNDTIRVAGKGLSHAMERQGREISNMIKNEVSIDVTEIVRVFRLLEEMNDLFHQPAKYGDPAVVKEFANEHYPEIKDLYYEVVWNWLPANLQNKITEA